MSADQWADENGNPMFDRTADSERTRSVTGENTTEAPTPEARIAKALEFASEYAYIDGDHHKMWVIDQMVRALTGCPVATKSAVGSVTGEPYTYEVQGESPEYHAFIGDEEWDEGIAP